MPPADPHTWTFKARFRRNAFGWRSQKPIQRVKEAVSEIKKVRRSDPVLAAEGAVLFLERISPALEGVDSSSGAIGNAVNRAIDQLVPILADAPVDDAQRRAWLDRLITALREDQIPYIERLGDHWGDLCATREIASEQADALVDDARLTLDLPAGGIYVFFGTSACLSALYRAERFGELVELAGGDRVYWPWKRWAVRALAAQGRKAEAIRLAEASRGPWSDDVEIDRLCEEILLSSGMVDEAYRRYGLTAHRRGTFLATFRAVARRYPSRSPEEILDDLAATTPGEEGKWFAAAKSAGLFDRALDLARRSPCDPRTLTRAARDLATDQPAFAVEAGILALHWLGEGYGYEISSTDVLAAYDATRTAAQVLGKAEEVEQRVQDLVTNARDGFVRQVLGPKLGTR